MDRGLVRSGVQEEKCEQRMAEGYFSYGAATSHLRTACSLIMDLLQLQTVFNFKGEWNKTAEYRKKGKTQKSFSNVLLTKISFWHVAIFVFCIFWLKIKDGCHYFNITMNVIISGLDGTPDIHWTPESPSKPQRKQVSMVRTNGADSWPKQHHSEIKQPRVWGCCEISKAALSHSKFEKLMSLWECFHFT